MSEEYTAEILEPMLFSVRNDYVFKKIFSSELNKNILTEFVCRITGINSQNFDKRHLEKYGNREKILQYENGPS